MTRACARILLAFATLLAPASYAIADTTVRVLETWPSGDDVTLARNQNFYLRLAYDTDVPVGIWVTPYFHGVRVNAGSSPSVRYSGSGEALGWFFFMQPGDEVDEIRVTAGDGSTRNTSVVATWIGHVVAGSAPATARPEPEWVRELGARAKAALDEANHVRMNQAISAGDVAFAAGFMLMTLALGVLGLVAPAWGLWHWSGGWRLATAVPGALMAFVVLRIGLDAARDPTSHNLWPFEILQAGALSAAAMAVLALARKLSGAVR